MILGMSLATFTLVHVLISLVGIVTGFVVMFGMLGSKRFPGWTLWFLTTTVLTSATGFLFPFTKLLPSHIVATISLVLLAIALFALYGQHLSGIWRPIYVVTAIMALWFNVFVLIAQAFLKIAPLKALAPTGSEPPFLIAQGAALIFFVIVAIIALKKFRPAT